MSTIGQRIGERMREIGLTQVDLARLLRDAGWPNLGHQTTIARVLSGARALKFDEGFVIADILGVSPAYLAGREEREQPPSGNAVAKTAIDRAIRSLEEIKEGL